MKAVEKDENTIIYMSGFGDHMTKEEVVKFLDKKIGNIKMEQVLISKNRSFAIITFDDRQVAHNAMKLMARVRMGRKKTVFQDRPTKEIAFEMIINERDWSIVSRWIRNKVVAASQRFNSSLDPKTSLLHLASIDENILGMDTILNTGININVRDCQKRTPIHYACIFGRLKSLAFLLCRGADIEVVDVKRNTPMHYASVYGFGKMVEAMVRYQGYHNRPPIVNWRGKTPQDLWGGGKMDVFSKYEMVNVGFRRRVIHKSERVNVFVFCKDPSDGRTKILTRKQILRNLKTRYFCKKRIITLRGIKYAFVLYYFARIGQHYIIMKESGKKKNEHTKVYYCRNVRKSLWEHFFRMKKKHDYEDQRKPSTQIELDEQSYDDLEQPKQEMEQQASKMRYSEVRLIDKNNVDMCLFLPEIGRELHFFLGESWTEFICEFDIFQDLEGIVTSVARALSSQTYGALSHHHQNNSMRKVFEIIRRSRHSFVHNHDLVNYFFLQTEFIKMDDLDEKHYTGEEGPPVTFRYLDIEDVFQMMRWKKYVDEEEEEGEEDEIQNKYDDDDENEVEEEEEEEEEGEKEEEEEDESFGVCSRIMKMKKKVKKVKKVKKKKFEKSRVRRRHYFTEPQKPTPMELQEFIWTCEKVPLLLKQMKNHMLFPFRIWRKIFEFCNIERLCYLRTSCSYLRGLCYESKHISFNEYQRHPKVLLTKFLYVRSITLFSKDNFDDIVYNHISQNNFLQELRIYFDISPVMMNKVSKVLINKPYFRSLCLRDCRHLSSFEFLRLMLGKNSRNRYFQRIELGGIMDSRLHKIVSGIFCAPDSMKIPELVLWDTVRIETYPIWRPFLEFVKADHLFLNTTNVVLEMSLLPKYNRQDWINLEGFWNEMFLGMERNQWLIEASSNIPTFHVIRRRSPNIVNMTYNVPFELMTPEERQEELNERERRKRMRGTNNERNNNNDNQQQAENLGWEEGMGGWEGGGEGNVFVNNDGNLNDTAQYFDSTDVDPMARENMMVEERTEVQRRRENDVETKKMQKKIQTIKGKRDSKVVFSIFFILFSIILAFCIYDKL